MMRKIEIRRKGMERERVMRRMVDLREVAVSLSVSRRMEVELLLSVRLRFRLLVRFERMVSSGGRGNGRLVVVVVAIFGV